MMLNKKRPEPLSLLLKEIQCLSKQNTFVFAKMARIRGQVDFVAYEYVSQTSFWLKSCL